MKIQDALHYKLANTSGVTDLVSSRIYQVEAPQEVVHPFIVFTQVGGFMPAHTSYADDHPRAARVQVSAWSKSLDEAQDIAEAVIDAIQDFIGTMGGAGGVTVQRIFRVTEPMEYRDPTSGWFSVATDYLIWYEES